MLRNCKYCNKIFDTNIHAKTYCSEECVVHQREEDRILKGGKPLRATKLCAHCGNDFSYLYGKGAGAGANNRNRKFCSDLCQVNANTKTCLYCSTIVKKARTICKRCATDGYLCTKPPVVQDPNKMTSSECYSWVEQKYKDNLNIDLKGILVDLITVYISIGGNIWKGDGFTTSIQLTRMWKTVDKWYLKMKKDISDRVVEPKIAKKHF
jgi:hypothetical protein